MAGGQSEALEAVDPFTLRYKVLGEIGEGSYSKVLKCRRRDSGDLFACKRLKHSYRSWGQVAEIPEIITLRKLVKHPNILQMSEIHFDPNLGRVSLVFELMDMNLYELIKDRKRLLQESRVRNMIFQLVRGLRHLHKHGIFHRDVKPENILLKRTEDDEDEVLKLGDLGSVRGLYSRPPYTEYISTRWYRSPECLLTPGFYSIKMDIWATGCVFYEVLTLRPLFPGASEVDQINRIHNIIGPPPTNVLTKFTKYLDENRNYPNRHTKQARFDSIKKTLSDLKNGNGKASCDWYFGGGGGGVERLLPNHISPEARDLLTLLLQYDPELRPTAHRALAHPYFAGLRQSSRLALHEDAQAEVLVSIGTALKTLSEVEGMTGDLRTLGDVKVKRQAREVPSRIPVRLPPRLDPPPLVQETAPPAPPVGLKLKKVPSLNTYNLNNPEVTGSMTPKEEGSGKVKSYDEFNQKSKGSLPYEFVHIDPQQHRPHVNPQPTHGQGHKGQVSEGTLSQAPGKPTRFAQPAVRRAPPAQAHAHSKAASEAQLVKAQMLSPSSLRRINENRRLAQLEPITTLQKAGQQPPVMKSSQDVKVGGARPSLPKMLDKDSSVGAERAEYKREATPLPPLKDQKPARKYSYQLGGGAKEELQPIRAHKSMAPDLNWNYQKVREENLTPPPLSQRLVPRLEPRQADMSRIEPRHSEMSRMEPRQSEMSRIEPRHSEMSRMEPRQSEMSRIEPAKVRIVANARIAPPKPQPSLLDYQQFSARYKERGSRVVRRRREESIPSPDSSSSDYAPRRRAVPTKAEAPEKMSRLQEFIKTKLINPPKPKLAEVEQGYYAAAERIGGKSEAGLFSSTSYYPSLQGRIRVSKPSLALKSPSSHNLHPPPLLRPADKAPFSLNLKNAPPEKVPFSLNLKNPRDPPKFQREVLAKKKYSFLHEKQDFSFSSKSKLG